MLQMKSVSKLTTLILNGIVSTVFRIFETIKCTVVNLLHRGSICTSLQLTNDAILSFVHYRFITVEVEENCIRQEKTCSPDRENR